MVRRVVWTLLASWLAANAGAQGTPGSKSATGGASNKPEAKPAASAKPGGASTGAKASAKPSPAPLSEDQKRSYAIGMDVAGGFKRQSIALDPDAFARGMRDVFSGGPTLLTEQEVGTIIAALQTEMRQKYEAERQATAAKAKAEGEAYLTGNKAKPGVVTLESGLQYEVLQAGEGKKPTLEDTVICQYRGTLVDGTEFDSSYKRGEPASFPVKGVIKGWTEALQLMPVGSKWRIAIPSALAYGPAGTGPIPPNATLLFELELVGIK